MDGNFGFPYMRFNLGGATVLIANARIGEEGVGHGEDGERWKMLKVDFDGWIQNFDSD